MRYVCLVLAALCFVNGVQVFAFGRISMAMAGIAVLFGVPGSAMVAQYDTGF